VAQPVVQAPTPQQDFCATLLQEKLLARVPQPPPQPVERQEDEHELQFWALTKAVVAAIARIYSTDSYKKIWLTYSLHQLLLFYLILNQ
jgi:hypothetical protein